MFRMIILVVLLMSWPVFAGTSSFAGSLAYQNTNCGISVIQFQGMTPGSEIHVTREGTWLTPKWLDDKRLLTIQLSQPKSTRDIWMLDVGMTRLTTNGQVWTYTPVSGNTVVFTREIWNPQLVTQVWKMQIGQPGERIKSVGNRPPIKLMTAVGNEVFWVESSRDSPKEIPHDRIIGLILKDGNSRVVYQSGKDGQYQEISSVCQSWEAGKLLVLLTQYQASEPDSSKMSNPMIYSLDLKTGGMKGICQFCPAMGLNATITPGPVPEWVFINSPSSQGITLIEPMRGGISNPFRFGWDSCFSRPYGE